jgi:hypothetical protein
MAAPQKNNDHDLILKMSQQVEDIHERIDAIPRDCAAHSEAIKTLKAGQSNLWDAVDSKASWVAVAVVLTVFGAVLVGVIKLL